MPHRPILIVEDDADIRQTLSTALELEGYSVHTAQNGRDGIESFKKAVPSLILLDLMMPVMDGWEFLSATRANPTTAKIPVIVLSALDIQPQNLEDTCFIKKPFDLLKLLKTIDDLRTSRVL